MVIIYLYEIARWVVDAPEGQGVIPVRNCNVVRCGCEACEHAWRNRLGENYEDLMFQYNPPIKEVIMNMTTEELKRYCDNARAYGWEVGRGQSIKDVLFTHPDNPFTKPDWNKGLTKPGFMVTAVENPL